MITLHCRPADAPPTEVRIGHGLAAQVPAWAAGRRAFAFVDAAVADRAAWHRDWPHARHADGEAGKTLARAEALLRQLVAAGLDRQSLLVALGGGVVGDLGGLAAALFLRGIELWQVPTTLLAMVDSSVGGKTAVNLPEGKNLVGAVHPARLCVADVAFLDQLPPQEFRSGLAEVVKMAIGCDAALFERLQVQRAAVLARDPAVLAEVIAAAVAAKIAVVEGDVREHGARRLLNLGHTLGHALEAHGGYRQPHGLAVARGLYFALDVARHFGTLAAGDAQRAERLLADYGFVRSALPPAAELAPFLARDKKVTNGAVQFVVPTAIGRSKTLPTAVDDLLQLLAKS